MTKSLVAAAAILLALAWTIANIGSARAQGELVGVVPSQGGAESTCLIEHDASAAPAFALRGEMVTTTLHASALCAGETITKHIVLVLDASGSMAGNPTKEMKEAAANFVRDLRLIDSPEIQVGVVAYNSAAKTMTRLTNNEGRVIGAIRKTGAAGGTAIDSGIKEGLKVLLRGRPDPASPDPHEVMIVLSDGGNNAGCAPVHQAATQALGQGVLMVTVCIGTRCDAQCMRQVASGPRHFYHAASARGLGAVFDRISKTLGADSLKTMEITVRLYGNTRYVVGSADPEPISEDPSGIIVWRVNAVPANGITLTYGLLPLEAGSTSAFLEAIGEFEDNQGRQGTFAFEKPGLTVLAPIPVPVP